MLRRAFDGFDREKKGYISPDTVSDILRMMGIKVSSTSFKQIIEEIDEDGRSFARLCMAHVVNYNTSMQYKGRPR